MAILDIDIQAQAALTHTQADGSDIGGVPPASYGFKYVPGNHQTLLLWTSGSTDVTGKGYPAWMWYTATPRPILPNTGNLKLSFQYAAGGNLAGMNVAETDTILVIDGWKYNGSGQFNQSLGFQIVNAAGQWVTVGFNPGPMQVNVKRQIIWEYAFDTVGRTMSVIAITCAFKGYPLTRFPVLASQQKIPAIDTSEGGKMTPWKDGTYLQIQMGSMGNGLPWTLAVKQMKNIWC